MNKFDFLNNFALTKHCTCVLAESYMSSRDGIHLHNVVAVQFTVSVTLIQKGGTNPVGVTFYSFHLRDESIANILVTMDTDREQRV